MSNRPDPPDEATRLKRALLALQKMQSTIDALQFERHEPVAIIGLGCRFPGADTPEQFWRLLSEGRDAISEVPPSRWGMQYYDPDSRAPGKIATPFGGFIDDVDRFDAPFFGIAPREAASLDPQHRLLLEVGWEALEQAGIAADSLAGSATGIFVGISSNDFAQLVMSCDPAQIDHYMGSGNARSVAAGRLSYVLGLKGPSLSIDTACSSSLVAVHLACDSLRRQECHLALAGGVNLLFAPEVSVSHSRAQMLAPDGRCKTFDASADGFIRSEGCGVVVLKRLTSAIADRDNVLAVILGSAVNHDGRTSALTVPSGPSQEAVIRTALANAGIDGSSVSYVEAHGTGTRLGDPIEVGALAAVLCHGRDAAHPLILGSVKTNIGHLEAGAGIAGLIKTVLACQHRTIPAHLHVRELNPLIPWDQLPLRVATTSMMWPARGERRIAGVSSFGFSGTNAHVVVAEAQVPASEASKVANPPGPSLLVLSAKTEPALRQLAGRYVEHLGATSLDAADIAYSAASGRAHFAHRLAVTAASTESCREQLETFLGGRPTPGMSSSHVLIGDRPRVAFLFSGQGSQYPGMGLDLYRQHATFRASVDRSEAILGNWMDRPLTDLLFRASAEVLSYTKYTQPALFALEYALAELWRSWGIEPEALIGHSVGEYVAACVAGVFSLEDGLMLIARRAALMQSVTAAGAMVAALTDEAQVTSLLGSDTADVSIAAINGPSNVVISGARDRVRQLVETLTAAGVPTVPLTVSHAFHSPHMDACLPEFREVASRVRYAAPSIDIVCNVTGAIASDEMAGPDYWCRHLRQPVRFAAGVRTVERLGCDTCIEIGPRPVLLDLARQSFAPGTGSWLASLKPGQPDGEQILRSLGTMYTQGATIDWSRFYAAQPRNRVTLPLYPFERERHWLAPSTGRRAPSRPVHQPNQDSHPLLGCRRWVAGSDEPRFEARLAADSPDYLRDHQVFETPSLPASAYIEMALAAGTDWFGTQALTIQNVSFVRALRLDEPKLAQLVLRPHADGRMMFHIYSRSEANVDGSTTLHASGEIGPATDDGAGRAATLTRYRSDPGEPVPLSWFDAEFNRRGVRFGPAFSTLTQVWRGRDHVLALVEAPASAAAELARYHVHPAVLDACCRTSALFTFERTDELLLQVGIERLHYYRSPGRRSWASARVRSAGDPGREEWVADCEVFDEAGNCCLAIEGQSARRAVREVLDRKFDRPAAQHFELQWIPKREALVRTAAPVAPPDAIAEAIHGEIAVVAADSSLIEYGRLLLELDRLANAYVRSAFANSARSWRPGERFSTIQMAEEIGIVRRHFRLFERLLDMLGEAGWLHGGADGWEVASAAVVQTAPDQLLAALSAEFPEAVTELSLVRDSGERLIDVLRGKVDPLDFLFPKGQVSRITGLYEHTRGAVATHAVLRKGVARAVEAGGPRPVLRVLEIGGGTGAATASVLDVFDPLRTEYTFTDVSARFVTHAQQRFADYPFVSSRVLDIEQSPSSQGLGSDQFDLVLATNVLHVTRDLRQTAGYVRELLAPDGILLAVEGTSKSPWLDLVFGLLPGWWRFTDTDLRPSHPLISAEAWERLLAGQGFSHPRTTSAASGGALARQAAIVAQKPGAARSPHAAGSGGWLILADRGGIGAGVADLLQEQGAFCHLLPHEAVSLPSTALDPEIYRRQAERLRAAIRAFTTRTPLRGIVYLWALEAPCAGELSHDTLQYAAMEDGSTLLALLHAITDERLQDVAHAARIWVVTRDAQAAGPARKLSGLASAAAWGIGKVIALEHPDRLGGMMDLSADATPLDAATIVRQLVDGDDEELIAFRSGERLVARLVRSSHRSRQLPSIRPDATYLVTGGLGALGLQIVSWLTDRGARHVCLVGRSGAASDASRAALGRLRDRGVEVEVVQADIGDPIQVRRLFATMDGRPPLRGIVHAAGVPASGLLSEIDPAALRSAFAAKISGTWLLHELTRETALDFFVLCSSMVAVWGAKGQADYVAANAFLDAFAHYRRGLGLPALSIDWGPLGGSGMLPADSIRGLSRIGVATRPMSESGDVVGELLASDAVQVVVADIDWALLSRAYEVHGRAGLFEKVRQEPSDQPVRPKAAALLTPLLDSTPPHEREQMLRVLVQQTLAEVLGLTTAQISDPRMGFFSLGLDSLTAMEFRDRLEVSLGVPLPSTLALDYSTVESAAAFLLATISPPAPPPPASIVAGYESPDDAVRRLQRLSEAEVEAMLLKKLETL